MYDILLSELTTVLGVQPADIDLNASFVSNGGHSLSATAFISACRAQGFTVKYRTLMINRSLKEVIASAVHSAHKVMKSSTDRAFWISKPSSSLPTADEGHQDDFLRTASTLQNGRCKASSREDNRNQNHGGIMDHPATNIDSRKSDIAKSYQLPHSPALTPNLPSKLVPDNLSTQRLSSNHNPSFEDGSFTEMQLSLIHGSMKTPGTNVITHAATPHSKDIPVMKLA